MTALPKLPKLEFIPLFPVDAQILSVFKECTPKILVVADGFLSFGATDFGLSDFINTLKSTVIHGMNPIIKTAHRGISAADYTNFVFKSTTLSKSLYDVLFLFGSNSSGTLHASQIAIISQFMDDGGGVFATGDHANLGRQLSGDIPRVRGMRRWTGPSASSPERLSTNDPGSDNIFEFDDQSDSIPQKIYPAYTNSGPHALLQHPTKNIIEVFPDHPHESECTIPASLADPKEWPLDSAGDPVSPEIVAVSVSYGGGFTGKSPISTPRSFGAIATYDGHLANVGRISTDATWHHFINVNIISSSAGPGLQANPDAYERVNTYYGNIATWLMPEKTRRCLRWPVIVNICKIYPIPEFIAELLEKPEDLPTLLGIGREVQKVLSRFISPAQQQELVADVCNLHNEALAKEINKLRNAPADLDGEICQRLTPVALIQHAAFGSLLLAAGQSLPIDGDLESNFKAAGGLDGLDRRAKAAQEVVFRKLSAALRKARTRSDEILELI